jgi:hypothetical protein
VFDDSGGFRLYPWSLCRHLCAQESDPLSLCRRRPRPRQFRKLLGILDVRAALTGRGVALRLLSGRIRLYAAEANTAATRVFS